VSDRKYIGARDLVELDDPSPKKLRTFGDEPASQQAIQPASQPQDFVFPSRIGKKVTSIRLPINKLKHYKKWCVDNDIDLQDAVENAMDTLTGLLASHTAIQPQSQQATLINNDLNDQLVINDEKAKRILARYSELSKRAVTPKDIQRYGEVAHLSEDFILDVMRRAADSATQAKRQINGFGYFSTAILNTTPTPPPVVQNAPQNDFSACPDCEGRGFFYPQGEGNGVAKCKHANLTPLNQQKS
jgi:hypothetical protein